MAEHHFPHVVRDEAFPPAETRSNTKGFSCACLTFFLQSVAAGCWVGIDGLEFRAEDDLSGDDVAQVLFILTGGAFDFEGACGQCKGYQVIYEPAKPAQLLFKPVHPVGCREQPTLYYLT